MGKSGISYLDAVWNPILGCSPKMPCAARCWAWRTVARIARVVNPRQELIDNTLDWGPFGNKPCGWSGKSALVKPWLDAPLHWRKPQRIGVNFLGDMFAETVPDAWIDRVFGVVAECPQHQFYFLTKQAKRMHDYLAGRNVAGLRPNARLGVSVCNQAEADERIPLLLQTPAAFRWVSIEPMVGEVVLRKEWLDGQTDRAVSAFYDGDWDAVSRQPKLSWVVIGCESGPSRRPMPWTWAERVVAQCHAAHVPVFVKQIMDKDGRVSHNPTEWPEWLRQQEQP